MDPDDTGAGSQAPDAGASQDDDQNGGAATGGDGGDNNSDDGSNGGDAGAGDGGKKDGGEAPIEFELPDGRKVDKETFEYLWKEHFYPDYTKKSTAVKTLEGKIAELEGKLPDNQKPDYSNLTPEQREARQVIDSLKESLREEMRKEFMPLIQESRVASEEKEVQAEIKDLQGKYQDFNATKVIDFAMKNGIMNLENAYFLMNREKIVADAVEKARTADATNNARKGAASITPNSSSKPPAGLKSYDAKADSSKSISDLIEEGLSELANKS